MPAINVDLDDGVAPDLSRFEPSFGLSMRAAAQSTFNENPSVLLYDYRKLNHGQDAANLRGEKLDRATAEGMIKDAGVKLEVPADGFTKEALAILIKRRQDHAARQNVMDRTPWSWVGTPVRGTAMLLTGLTDPLNIASAFIPVVGEARLASGLARAGGSALARAGVRAGAGAVEGAVGAALMEPVVYGLHKQLQDDYSMTDSLINLGFGGILGASIHAGGGVVADAFRVGADPYARFAGLETTQVSQVLQYEKASRGGVASSTEGWTPAMKRAAGLEDPIPAQAVEAAAMHAPGEPRSELPSLDLAAAPEAPFARLYERTPEQARDGALAELSDGFRAELLAEAGNRAGPRAVPEKRAQLLRLTEQVEKLDSESEFKARAKLAQGEGLSRKQAESAARKQIAAERADAQASQARLQQQLDENARASQAQQDLGALEKGQVPARFEAQVSARADELLAAADIAKAITGQGDPPARFVVGMASPETREAALRSAVADMAQGRMPDVSAILGADPGTIGVRTTARDVAAVADRQRGPESVALGSPESSRAASERVKQAPQEHAVEAAKVELDDAMKRLASLQKNLELGGASPEKVAGITEGLKAFDEAIKDADRIGEALVQNALCGIRQ